MLSAEEKQAIVDLFPFMGVNPIVYDVGSNKGDFTALILEEFEENCFVYLFEPNEMLLNYTRIRFEYNDNVAFLNLAAHRSSGQEIPFYYFENRNNEISSLYKADDWVDLPMKERKVKTVALSHATAWQQIGFIKIDCEGADVDVLLGCEWLLKEKIAKIIQIEYSYHYKRANHTFREVFDLVEKYDYKVYDYKEGNFWEVKKESFVEDFRFENFFITKHDIHNYSVGGWNNHFKLSTADLPKFDLIVEVGAFEGLTTKYMHEKMLNEGGRIIVVDPLKDTYVDGDTEHPYFKDQYPRFLRNTRGLNVNLHRGNSEDELPKLNALRVGFSYIDGNHFSPHPYIDGVWCHAITKVGGYILFDDHTWRDETRDSIDKYLNEFSHSIEIIQKDYQVLVRKIRDQYNDITQPYYL